MPHAELLTQSLRKPRERSPSAPPALTTLVDEIDAACAGTDGPREGRIVAALRKAVARADLLTVDQRVSQTGCYARHVLYSDPAGRFTIVSIVWGPGQFSPTHAHHTWCAYAVHENALEEALYAWDDASATALPTRKEARPCGYGCFARAGLDQIHRLGNSCAEPAISIHVYGVEREQVCTHVNRVVQIA
jgi:predicted metal-dependent enzyme (double-stranded beta helix superfamily)